MYYEKGEEEGEPASEFLMLTLCSFAQLTPTCGAVQPGMYHPEVHPIPDNQALFLLLSYYAQRLLQYWER